MHFDPWTLALALLLVAWVSGLWPVWQHWSQRALHRLVAFSAGTFAGSLIHVCIDLLGGHDHGSHGPAPAPSDTAGGSAVAAEPGQDLGLLAADAHAGHDHGDLAHALAPDGAALGQTAQSALEGHGHGELFHTDAEPGIWGLWLVFSLGFLFLWWLDRRLKRAALHGHHDEGTHGEHAGQAPVGGSAVPGQHQWVWRASYLGLSIHSALAGLGLGGLGLIPEGPVWTGFALAFLAHQAVETFSMGTLMRLADLPRRRASWLLLPFAAVAPIAFVLGHLASLHLGALAPLAAAFSAGTFLFVTVFELLPESFHDPRGRWIQGLLILVGAGVALGLPELAARRPELLSEIAGESLAVFLEMAPFLLLGFLVAGLISTWLLPERLKRFLSGEGPRPVVLAALFGAPLPLCSCSVVPVAAVLRQSGAGRGPTSAFLISTPETGVDSIAATYGLMGPIMAIARPLAALFSAITTGLLVSWFERRSQAQHSASVPGAGAAASALGAGPLAAAGPAEAPIKRPFGAGFPGIVAPPQAAEDAACCHAPAPPPAADCCAEPAAATGSHADHDHTSTDSSVASSPRWRATLHYGFVRLIDDLAWPLVLGVVLSGLIGALVPEAWFSHPLLRGPLGYLAMLAVGIPIYVCASASTPIAASLILKGLSPGAALVFLLAGPATNLGSLLVLRRLLGGLGLGVHLLSLGFTTLLAGVGFDLLLAAFGLDVRAELGGHQHGSASWLQQIAALVLAGLLLASFVRSLNQRTPVAPERRPWPPLPVAQPALH